MQLVERGVARESGTLRTALCLLLRLIESFHLLDKRLLLRQPLPRHPKAAHRRQIVRVGEPIGVKELGLGEPVRKTPLFALVQFETERQPALTVARAGRTRRRRACPAQPDWGRCAGKTGLVCVYGNGRGRGLLAHGAGRAAQNVTGDVAGSCAMGVDKYNWDVGRCF